MRDPSVQDLRSGHGFWCAGRSQTSFSLSEPALPHDEAERPLGPVFQEASPRGLSLDTAFAATPAPVQEKLVTKAEGSGVSAWTQGR